MERTHRDTLPHVHHLHLHHHHHTPHSPPNSPEGYEAANMQHFNAAAHGYDENPSVQKRAEKIGQAMIATGLFKPGITTVMDFACGTGVVSRVLAAADPKSIVGVDISQGMVDQYNKTVSDHGISPEEMRAICTTLDDPEKKLEGMTFDVIVCVASYHHIASIEEVTNQLATYLKTGGSLLVTDLVHKDSTHEIFPESYHHIVAHKGGFTEEEIRSTFEKAGLKNITFEIIAGAELAGHQVDLFLARGDK